MYALNESSDSLLLLIYHSNKNIEVFYSSTVAFVSDISSTVSLMVFEYQTIENREKVQQQLEIKLSFLEKHPLRSAGPVNEQTSNNEIECKVLQQS